MNCPVCGTQGHLVDNSTIKCLISVSLHRVRDVQHRFCDNPACNVVYFAEDDSDVFYIADVRERVYQKEPEAHDVLVCYCFFHHLGEIKTEVNEIGHSTVVEDIRQGIQQGSCACDWRNPQGSCCLGNVIKIVKNHRL